MSDLEDALEDRDRSNIELLRDFQILRQHSISFKKSEEGSRRASPLPDSFPRIIFADGVDGAGKTTRIKNTLKLDFPFKYFRSSYQYPSKFANRPVDLEESIHHDWRLLYDFIHQTADKNSIYLVDRGFLSSFVYSKVLRKVNIYRYVYEYLKLFSPFSEYWIFTRQDYNEMQDWEKEVNTEFDNLAKHLSKKEIFIRHFFKTEDGKFTTNSFLDFDEQICNWGFDWSYYCSKLWSFRLFGKKVVLSDLDYTILHPGHPQGDLREPIVETVNYIKSKQPDVILIVTGRLSLDSPLKEQVRKLFEGIRVEFVCNSRNLGVSSRVLKRFVIEWLDHRSINYMGLDDRLDVLEYCNKSHLVSELVGKIYVYR